MNNHFRPLLWSAVLLTAISITSYSQIGEFKEYIHVGTPEQKGKVNYDAENQQYTLEGASGNMWGTADDFHFLWKKMKGNFIVQALIEFGPKGSPSSEMHRKLGIMVRHSLESNSPHANAVIHGGDGLTSLQYRKSPGAVTEETKSTQVAPNVIQLERRGSKYIMSVAHFGEPFTVVENGDLTLGDDVYVGIFVCSHNQDISEKVFFRNVRITVPVKEDFIPYKDYIGSRLEVLDVEKGLRKVVHTDPGSLQGPNWTKDGKSLIYNHNGLLYNFDLNTLKPTKINSEPADKNNNDHVLSFDGKLIGISSNHSKPDSLNSVVYYLPVKGGTPKRVTQKSPSYLHGWSPDGKSLIFTGGRGGEYDLYKISVNGGKETRLTAVKGLDDGSEYSPDGRYIYFNSVRSGTMQLWRMKPDGKNPEQITSDEYNNWFPHISPDGKWILFLSFMKDVDPGDHPWYKHVYLRLMPITGGKATVVAYLYGGQGSINVPSWSPDSKKVAFVSNSDLSVPKPAADKH